MSRKRECKKDSRKWYTGSMGKRRQEEFYYHAAIYLDEDLAGKVFQTLNTLINSVDYNLSVYRCLEPESHAYCVVVIGERPNETLDKEIIGHLISTGEMVALAPGVLQHLLGRRPDMN